MAGKLTDRILTIVVTATLTSAVWIIAGGSLIEMADSEGQKEATRPAEAAPSPAATNAKPGPPDTPGNEEIASLADGLDIQKASEPEAKDTRNLMIPVLNVRPRDLSDTYSIMGEGGTAIHEALDIMAPVGTSIVAAGPGIVEKMFVSEAGGRTIYVRSTDRQTIHYYAHLGEYADGLQEGQRVRRGQRLGTVGTTGNASADKPHLHFAILRTTKDAEWWEPASAVNPYPLLTER